MVYESDFYTTRRPYSSRPVVSSYSVTTPLRVIPTGFSRVQTYTTTYPIYSSYPTVIHRSIPFVAHKRIVTSTRISSTPTRVIRSPTRVIASPLRIVNVRVRPSVTNRRVVEHKVRSHPHYYATENYLNSSYAKDFDDETRELRTATNSLLRKVHTNVQRAHSVSPISYSSKYEQRYGTDAYLAKALGASRISDEINREINTKYNANDSNRKYVGKSHLASVRIVGDKGYSKRSQIIPTTPLFFRKDKVRKDINFLSYYKKNIAAADAHQQPTFSLPSERKAVKAAN
ncbi:uncharacterized protein CG45076-like isoform X6 [Bradysia coprophila]|uniref:uncharacterized protein CG45076-like isoform X6 n=1 Tax=Bradysia coprophila TaxID=38358 RepID=UPI00187D79EB|nr:uncharacterized protein CG45076-like isoform X6 [Bradysia coprophila]